MSSTDRDLTARAIIRNAALRLFADRGPESVTLREVAAEADVSAALVVHHYGGKEGLRSAVDEYAAGMFDEMLAALEQDPGEMLAAGSSSSLSEVFAAAIPADSPLPAYLRRMLLAGQGSALFARWFALTRALMGRLAEAGFVEATDDPDTLAAFLLANDLALILLRPQLIEVLDQDPLSREGLERWTEVANGVYRSGVFRIPDLLPTQED
ncbi:MAG: helix-turn-helix domain-containing protein [Nocardioides sp.]